MGHNSKKGENNEIRRVVKFKVDCSEEELKKWKLAMEESCRYYNIVSDCYAKLLTTETIGSIAKQIHIKKTPHDWYKLAFTDEFKDLPFYQIFSKYPTLHADNLLYWFVVTNKLDGYNGNIFDIIDSSYRKGGYFTEVASNYRTKIATMKIDIKYKSFNPDTVTDDVLMEQTIYDIEKYNIDNFDDTIKYFKERGKEDKVRRFECESKFYSKHKDEVDSKTIEMKTKKLLSFGGCKRKSATSIKIKFTKGIDIEKVGLSSFSIKMLKGKKKEELFKLNLLGNRQVVKVINGKRVDLVDLKKEKLGEDITLTIKNNEMFAHITIYNDFSKEKKPIVKHTGIDINIKHSHISTSILDDGSLKGYVNIYKHLLNDAEFVSTMRGQEELDEYNELAKSVSFGLMETESLFERWVEQCHPSVVNARLLIREQAIQRVIKGIIDSTPDIHIQNYLYNTLKFRAKIKAYFVLKETYSRELSKYDSTEGKTPAERNEIVERFNNTEIGQEILKKLNNVSEDILGCKKLNIITYAFNVIKNNGYDTIGLEYLESSQFEKTKIPTPDGIVYKMGGLLENEVLVQMKAKRTPVKYYKLNYDENGKLVSAEYTESGEKRRMYEWFKNLIIKAVQWASTKDRFVQLANNNDMNIVYVPAAFTSQIDSKTHSVYKVKDKNGKFVIASKYVVRGKQERHINGLNADYNSACNIDYIVGLQAAREMMTNETADGPKMYNVPGWNIKKNLKNSNSMKIIGVIDKLYDSKCGEIDENGNFCEIESEK